MSNETQQAMNNNQQQPIDYWLIVGCMLVDYWLIVG